jgi:hypothetical protein
MHTRLGLLTLAAVLAVAAAAFAKDLVIRERTSIEGPHPKTFEATQYYGDRKLVTDGPRQRTIIDLDAKTMTAVDKESKAYTVTTFDAVRQAQGSVRQAFERLPPEKQKEQLGSDVKISTTPTDHTEKIAGYPCKEWVVDAGPMRASLWVTEKLAMPAGRGAWDNLLPSMRGVSRLGDRFQDALSQVKGVALRKTILRTDKDGSPLRREVTEALSVSVEPPPAEMIALPDGFTRWTLPAFGRPPGAD